MEIAPTEAVALRVAGPYEISDAKRLKQVPARKLLCAFARRLTDKSLKQMHPRATVNETLSGTANDGTVEHELHPIRALTHLTQCGFAGLRIALQAGLHSQKILDRQCFLRGVPVADVSIGE